MKKYDKNRLFEVMGRVDKTFKLNEGWVTVKNDAGEPMGTEYQPDSFDPQDQPELDDREYQPYEGLRKFNRIDWKIVHEILVSNSDLINTGKAHEGINKNDFIDDGILTSGELEHLQEWNIIYIDKSTMPEIDDEKYRDFDTFKAKIAEIWEKEPTPTYRSAKGDSETPYLRGYEPMSEDKQYDDSTTKQIIGTLIDAKNNIQDIFEKLPIAAEIPQEEAKVLEDAMKVLHTLESRYSSENYGIKAIQEGNRSGFNRLTVFRIYDKNGSYLGDLDPIDEENRAGEFYEGTKTEVFRTPEFQKFAQERNTMPEQIGRVVKSSEYTMDGNPLSFEYYAPSDSEELYDEKTRIFYNRSGQRLRNPEEYNRRDPEWTPFGDEGDNY